MLFHFTQTKASCQIPKDKSLHHSKCLLIMWNISNFDAKFWLFCFICDFNFISSNNGTDNVSKISFFFLLAICRWNPDRGNSIFVSTFCGAWLKKVKVDCFLVGYTKFSCHTRVPDFRLPMKNGDSSTCLVCIVYNWEVNSRDDNKRLVMGKKTAVVVTSLHEKLFDP